MAQVSSLGEAFIAIRATLDKLDDDLAGARSKIDGALSKISGAVQKAGTVALAGITAGVVAIGAGVIAIGKQAIPAASNLNESLNATSVVFGEAADIVQSFGKTASDSAGLSEAAFNQLAATTGAMLQNYGFDAETAAESTVDLTQRAADMASIFNTDVDEALTAINAALRGEADPIERFGVSMNAAAVEAKALELGLEDANGELDNTALTQARLALLFEQTDKIAGDFVNTSGDLANATRVQQARWENFMARIGSFALPILNTFQGLFLDLGETIFPLVENAIAPVAEIIQTVVSIFASFIQEIMNGTDPIQAFGDVIWQLSGYFVSTEEQATAVKDRFFELVSQAQELAANILVLIDPIIQAVTNFVSFQDVLIGLGVVIASVIIPIVISLVASLLPIIATIAAVIGVVSLLRNAWEEDWGGIRTSLTAWWEETGQPIFDLLRKWLAENIPLAIERLKSFWENVLLPAIQIVWGWISGTLIPFFQNVLIPWISENIPKAIQTLSDFWTETLQPAIEKVWNFVTTSLIPLFESLWELLNVAGTKALEAITGLWQNILQPALEGIWRFIQDNLIPIFETLAKNLEETLSPVLEWLSNQILTKVTDGFEGIKNAIQFVIEKVQALTAKLANIKLPDFLTPGSPTPFELGLKGINSAMALFNQLLDQNSLLSDNLSVNPMLEAAANDSQGSPVSYNSETTIYTNQDPLRVLRASRHLDKLGEIP